MTIPRKEDLQSVLSQPQALSQMIDLLQVTEPRLAYLILGGFVVVFGMFSLLIREKLYISEVVVGTAFGVIMGPYCADAFDPRGWASDTRMITLEVMRVVLVIGLFAIGVELPESYMKKHIRGLIVLVVPTMAIGWLAVAGLMSVLFPPLSFLSCLAIAACLTPTDPVISAAIVGNGKYALEHVPSSLRHIISAEAAANDGLAYPFLSLTIYLTIEATKGEAFKKWILVGCLYQVILGTAFGAIVGYGFRKLLTYSHDKGLADHHSFVVQYLALALFTAGVASALGMDDLLAAFAAGCAVAWDGKFKEETEKESFSAVVDLMLNCACFIYIGAWLDFQAFNSPQLGITPWRLFILFLWIMAFRRIPAVLMLYKWVPEVRTWKEALFTGHFGPVSRATTLTLYDRVSLRSYTNELVGQMGVGAVFVSTLALSELKVPHGPPQNQEELLAATLQIIVSFVVLGSIIIHGLSIPFFSASRQIQSRTVSLTKTWTSGVGRSDQAQADWTTWIRRPESAAPSQIVIDRDEEAGDRSEVQTRIGEISEIDENEEVSSVVKQEVHITLAPRGLGEDSNSGPTGQRGKAVRFPPIE